MIINKSFSEKQQAYSKLGLVLYVKFYDIFCYRNLVLDGNTVVQENWHELMSEESP